MSSRTSSGPVARSGSVARGPPRAAAPRTRATRPVWSSATGTTATNAPATHVTSSRRALTSPMRTASVRFPTWRRVSTSRMLLASRIAHASRPTASAPHHAGRGHALELHVGTAARWRRSRRTRAPRPRPTPSSRRASARRCRARPRRSTRHRRPAATGSTTSASARPTTAATPNDEERAHCAPRAGDARPRRGEAERARAGRVGAAHAVGVVVGVVHADLERERDDEREQRSPPEHVARLGRGPPRCRRAPARPRRRASAAARPRATGAAPRGVPVGHASRPLREPVEVGAALLEVRAACPPAPPRSCNRGASRRPRAAGCRRGRRRPRSSTPSASAARAGCARASCGTTRPSRPRGPRAARPC